MERWQKRMKTEEEILNMLHRGEEEAVRYMFDMYFDKLCLFAESIIRDHQAAQDIVEDLFITVWLHAETNPIRTALANYLFRSTHNNCIKYLNKLRKEARLAEELSYTIRDEEITDPLTHAFPFSGMALMEMERKAEAILESLPEQCRIIYTMSRFGNLSYPEIAGRLKITVGTVKTQMSRAFQRFREGLAEFLALLLLLLHIF